jgi:hypothetical protein
MKKYLMLYLIVFLSSCKEEFEYIQVTNFYSEDPHSPKTAIRVNNLGEVFYCVERSPDFEFPNDEVFVFDYYKALKKVDWNTIRNAFVNSSLTKTHEKFEDVSHPSISVSYKLGDTLGVIQDFDYLVLKEEEKKIIYDLIDKVDTANAKKIKYYPFNIEILAKPLPLPPKEE